VTGIVAQELYTIKRCEFIKRNTDVPLASRVSGIRFTMHNDAPARTGETIYREIDVFGSPGDTETTRGRPVPAPSVAPTP